MGSDRQRIFSTAWECCHSCRPIENYKQRVHWTLIGTAFVEASAELRAWWCLERISDCSLYWEVILKLNVLNAGLLVQCNIKTKMALAFSAWILSILYLKDKYLCLLLWFNEAWYYAFHSTEDMWKCYITFCLERCNRKTNSEELKQKVKRSLGNYSNKTRLFLLTYVIFQTMSKCIWFFFIRNRDKWLSLKIT